MTNKNQSLRQAAVRAITGTLLTYESDWHSLWDYEGVAAGTFNGRMLAWIKSGYPAAPDDVTDAMNYYAQQLGYNDWDSLTTVVSLLTSDNMTWDATDNMVWDATDNMTWN